MEVQRSHKMPKLKDDIAQMVQQVLANFFSSDPEFKSQLGRFFILYRKTIVRMNPRQDLNYHAE